MIEDCICESRIASVVAVDANKKIIKTECRRSMVRPLLRLTAADDGNNSNNRTTRGRTRRRKGQPKTDGHDGTAADMTTATVAATTTSRRYYNGFPILGHCWFFHRLLLSLVTLLALAATATANNNNNNNGAAASGSAAAAGHPSVESLSSSASLFNFFALPAFASPDSSSKSGLAALNANSSNDNLLDGLLASAATIDVDDGSYSTRPTTSNRPPSSSSSLLINLPGGQKQQQQQRKGRGDKTTSLVSSFSPSSMLVTKSSVQQLNNDYFLSVGAGSASVGSDFGSLFIEAILNGTRTAVERYLMTASDGSPLCSQLQLRLDNRQVANYSTLQVLMIDGQRIHMRVGAAPGFCRMRVIISGAPLPSVRLRSSTLLFVPRPSSLPPLNTMISMMMTPTPSPLPRSTPSTTTTTVSTPAGGVQIETNNRQVSWSSSDTRSGLGLVFPTGFLLPPSLSLSSSSSTASQAGSSSATTVIASFNLTSEALEFSCDLIGDFLGYANVVVQLQQNATAWNDMFRFRVSVAKPQPVVQFVLQQSAICIVFIANFAVGLQTDFGVFQAALRRVAVVVAVAVVAKLVAMPLICFGLLKLFTFEPDLTTAGLFLTAFSPTGLEAVMHCLLLTALAPTLSTGNNNNGSMSATSKKSAAAAAALSSSTSTTSSSGTDYQHQRSRFLQQQAALGNRYNNSNNEVGRNYERVSTNNAQNLNPGLCQASAVAATIMLSLASFGWLPLGFYISRTLNLPASLIQDAGDKFLFFESAPPSFEIIPYAAIAISLGCLVLPFSVGVVIRSRWKKAAFRLRGWFIALVYLALLHIFITLVFANMAHVLHYLSLSAIIGAIVITYCTAAVSVLLGLCFRQDKYAILAVAIVVGCPNATIALHLVQANLEPPATDLALILPTIATLILQLPLFVTELCQAFIYCIRSANNNNSHKNNNGRSVDEFGADYSQRTKSPNSDDNRLAIVGGARVIGAVRMNAADVDSTTSSNAGSNDNSHEREARNVNNISIDTLENCTAGNRNYKNQQLLMLNHHLNRPLSTSDDGTASSSPAQTFAAYRSAAVIAAAHQGDYMNSARCSMSSTRSPLFSSHLGDDDDVDLDRDDDDDDDDDDDRESDSLPLPTARASKSALILVGRNKGRRTDAVDDNTSSGRYSAKNSQHSSSNSFSSNKSKNKPNSRNSKSQKQIIKNQQQRSAGKKYTVDFAINNNNNNDNNSDVAASSPAVVRFHPIFSSTSKMMPMNDGNDHQMMTSPLLMQPPPQFANNCYDVDAYANHQQVKVNSHLHQQQQLLLAASSVATASISNSKQRYVHFNENNNGISVENVQDWSKLILKTSAPVSPAIAASTPPPPSLVMSSSMLTTTTSKQHQSKQKKQHNNRQISHSPNNNNNKQQHYGGGTTLIPVVLETVV